MPRLVQELMERFPGHFGSAEAALRFTRQVWFPASRSWRYQLNGKSGTTYVLNLLFELEYGAPFTCQVSAVTTGNQHPDFALFQLSQAGLYSNSVREEEDLAAFDGFKGLSLATVRNPYSRALSGYRYICRSHEAGDRRFLAERIRMNALAGMNWDLHLNTPEGFGRFLSYIREQADTMGPESVDAHWMQQVLHIRPDIYQPDLIGRTDRLEAFSDEVAARLDRPRLQSDGPAHRNQTSGGSSVNDSYLTPERRRIIEEVYGPDLEFFESL
jgi:hypothetical protein